VLELKNLVMHQKVAKEDLVVVKEEVAMVAANAKATAAAREKAMVVVNVKAMAVATEEVLAVAADVKAEAALVVDSEISLVNLVKAEAEQAKEDADLNHPEHHIIRSSPINRAAFFCLSNLNLCRSLLDRLRFPALRLV